MRRCGRCRPVAALAVVAEGSCAELFDGPPPKPQTPNPKPQNPKPQTPTPNPKPQTPNPKPQTPSASPPPPLRRRRPADLVRALRQSGAAVLEAPTGAGKTTRVPLALLGAVDGVTVMLEPRRIAARAAARRLAAQLGERVGETVGLRVRGETRVSRRTRVEVVTEGVLTRRLLSDPGLEGVGAVVFDEVHERSLQTDLGLALCLHARALLRPDLWLLAMSATLDGARFAALLGDGGPAPVVTSRGRTFPVEARYLGTPQATAGGRRPRIEDAVRTRFAGRSPKNPGASSRFCRARARSGAPPSGWRARWAATWISPRCTAICRRETRTRPSSPLRRDGGKWCWRRASPRRA